MIQNDARIHVSNRWKTRKRFAIACLVGAAVLILNGGSKYALARDLVSIGKSLRRNCAPPAKRFFRPSSRRRVMARNRSTAAPASAVVWKPLFDGKSLDGWVRANFGGEGDIEVKNGTIIMDQGSSLTGITYKGDVPKSNYEIRFEAMRSQGIDFFCGLTFPVGESHCSFIAAGWAGAVVGLSSIDGSDASDNETTTYMNFKNDKWYRIRVRVTDKAISAWIDDKQVINQSIVGRRISTRPEVDLSKPLGISAWESTSHLRKIEIRELNKK